MPSKSRKNNPSRERETLRTPCVGSSNLERAEQMTMARFASSVGVVGRASTPSATGLQELRRRLVASSA